MESLLEEYAKWSSFRERNLIKPFSALSEVWLLLYDETFITKIHEDKKFFMFVRKKLFWVLNTDHDEQYLMYKGFIESETDELLISIADQVLLTYFEPKLSFFDLCNISIKNDEYNSINAYFINSIRGGEEKAPLN
jgi:hypothetical protein